MTDIVDIHTHLGRCRVFDLDEFEEELFKEEKKNKVSTMLIQPYPGAPDPGKVHDRIAKLSNENPGKVYGIMSLNPHMDKDKWVSEAERLVKDEGFVGIKLHTIGHAVNPLSNDGKTVFETADRLGVPVMVHTGLGVPFALPSMVLTRAKQYPNLPIILAHAGYGVYVGEALVTALQFDNIFLEPSHVAIGDKSDIIKNVSSEKILFGSDLPVNISTELHQFTSLVKDARTLDKILGGNARRIFKLR